MMTKRVLSYVAFFLTTGIVIWQQLCGGNLWVVAVLAIVSLTFLIIIIFPTLKVGYRMISTIWKSYRHPDNYLYVQNVCVELLPSDTPGKGFVWICGFQIVSNLFWNVIVNRFELEITQPDEIAGVSGYIGNTKILGLSKTNVCGHRMSLNTQMHTHLQEKRESDNNYLPITLVIKGRASSGKLLVYDVVKHTVKL
jgi:hypothetical protein